MRLTDIVLGIISAMLKFPLIYTLNSVRNLFHYHMQIAIIFLISFMVTGEFSFGILDFRENNLLVAQIPRYNIDFYATLNKHITHLIYNAIHAFLKNHCTMQNHAIKS